MISLLKLYLGDHPKTAEAIARKINLILGDTRETLAAKTGRPIDTIYEDEAPAIVIHGDDIDDLQGWQWDQSKISCFRFCSLSLLTVTMIVFSKEEIVFARTSPKHKLEIGKCNFKPCPSFSDIKISQTCTSARPHCWSVCKCSLSF